MSRPVVETDRELTCTCAWGAPGVKGVEVPRSRGGSPSYRKASELCPKVTLERRPQAGGQAQAGQESAQAMGAARTEPLSSVA